ncbi:MAG: acyl-[acyl-carrier-protein]--UDP-N-acetylglucosamine O-acyltransferase [Arcobacter sp.]|nr:MAG: acyl-[acyl-carrier-protein]--UDP-N-acetylglucosamine O-acyltransferase [Arcobacter sp.]
MSIHATAIIKDGAIIGDNVSIGAFTIIDSNVTVGDNTVIGSHTFISGHTTIGENNTIYSHAVLGTDPQDLKYNGEKTYLIIGNNNTIREHTLINTGTAGGGFKTIIGDKNLIMGHVHMGHDCIIGNNIVIANSTVLAGHVQIANNAVIGGISAIHQFCKVGEFAMLGGGSIVVQDIPPYCICEGNRASLRGLNINGLRRNFENREDINEIKKAYKKIFESGNPLAQSANELLESSKNKYVKLLSQFVLDTKRGIPFTRKNKNEK